MRSSIASILGDPEGAWDVDPRAIDQQPHHGLPAFCHLDEVVRRPAIPVVAARGAVVILIQAVVHATVVDVSQCGHGPEGDEDGQVLDLHGRGLILGLAGRGNGALDDIIVSRLFVSRPAGIE